jgi:hypothetical protein
MDAAISFVDQYRKDNAGNPQIRYMLQKQLVIRYIVFLKRHGRAFPFGTHTVQTPLSDSRTFMELHVGPSIRHAGLYGGFLSSRGTKDAGCPYGGWIMLCEDYNAFRVLIPTAAGTFTYEGLEYTIVGDPTSAVAQICHTTSGKANAFLSVNPSAVRRQDKLCVHDNFATIKLKKKSEEIGAELAISYDNRGGQDYFNNAPVSCDWCFGKHIPDVSVVYACPASHCFHKRGYHRSCWTHKHKELKDADVPTDMVCEFCEAKLRTWVQPSEVRHREIQRVSKGWVRRSKSMLILSSFVLPVCALSASTSHLTPRMHACLLSASISSRCRRTFATSSFATWLGRSRCPLTILSPCPRRASLPAPTCQK